MQVMLSQILSCATFYYDNYYDDDDDDSKDDHIVGHSTLSHTLSELFTSDFLVSFPMFLLANVSVRRYCLFNLPLSSF